MVIEEILMKEEYILLSLSPYSSWLITSRCQPVKRQAKRTFWPFLPMAMDRNSSGTTISITRFSSSITTLAISAGARALQTNFATSGFHWTISIFSPRSSWTILCTRFPFIPTQAPTGSTSESEELTATFERIPGSRAAP